MIPQKGNVEASSYHIQLNFSMFYILGYRQILIELSKQGKQGLENTTLDRDR